MKGKFVWNGVCSGCTSVYLCALIKPLKCAVFVPAQQLQQRKERCGCNNGCLKSTGDLQENNYCVMNHEKRRILQRSGANIPLSHALSTNKPIPKDEPTLGFFFVLVPGCLGVWAGTQRDSASHFSMEPIEGSL